MADITEATREILWNVSGVWLMYGLTAAALAVFGWGLYRRIASWRRGRADDERLSDWGKRLWILLRELLLQPRTRHSRWPGIFHSLIYYSFAVLALTTFVVMLDCDFGTHLFHGYLYALLTVAAEVAGLLILVGLAMAAWRRYVARPATLPTSVLDGWALALLAALVVTGFATEGLRLAATADEWAALSPVGYVASLAFVGLSPPAVRGAHQVLWWSHTLLALVWIASIPYTKFFHLLALPANVFFSKLRPRGELRRVNIEELMSREDLDADSLCVGIQKPSHFTWKQRLDFDACVSCGRCDEICPARLAQLPFAPRELVATLRDAANNGCSTPLLPEKPSDGSDSQTCDKPCAGQEPDLVGKALDEEYLWHCRTCMACMEVCPAAIDHVDTMMEIRRNEVLMQGRIPSEAARALRAMETQGNPFGPQTGREDWIAQLGVRVVGPGESCDVLFWIGCCTVFDPTKQRIATDLCELLMRCGLDFGVLGSDERCCGDPARVLGDERLFQEAARIQVEALNQRTFQVLLVNCPHCYNVLKNEYPQFGGSFNVVHHSEFLHEMIWAGRLLPGMTEPHRVVYHDPCYLGRYQKIYDAPRQALRGIPGTLIVEMPHHHERSLCCGGGGGHFWMDIKKGKRINNLRVDEARDVGADTIVTGCAYCLQMMNDAVKMRDLDDQIQVKDLASYVLESLPPLWVAPSHLDAELPAAGPTSSPV